MVMTCSKPENIKEELWAQHLSWLELVRDEFKSNWAKYLREKQREREVVNCGDQR
jgi:hypothetical protein